jgi:hypothetical protein
VLDADRVVDDLGERREAVRRAGRVGDDVVGVLVVLIEVDAQHHRDVLVRRRGRDDDLGRARVEVLGGVGALGEEAGGLDDDVGAQVAPRQVGRVALGEHLEQLAVDQDAVIGDLDRPGVRAQDRVVLQQVRERLRVGQVVDGDPLDVGVLGLGGTEEVAADAAEAVDPDAYGHAVSVLPEGRGDLSEGRRTLSVRY